VDGRYRYLMVRCEHRGMARRTAHEVNRECRLRSRARRLGFSVHKSRASESVENHGGYMLVDDRTNSIADGERFDLDLDGLEASLSWIASRAHR
jgi:hypothetical protein